MSRRFSPAVILSAVILLTSACSNDPEVPGTSQDKSFPESKGRIVASDISPTQRFAVTSDSRYVIAVSASGSKVVRYEILSGKDSTLVALPGADQVVGLTLIGDHVYYVRLNAQTGSRALLRVVAGLTETLTPSSAIATDRKPAGEGVAVVASAAGTVVAYVAEPDSLYTYSPATRTSRFIANGCEEVVAMSPDGGQVLCFARTLRKFSIVDVVTRQATPASFIPDSEYFAAALWNAAGLRVIHVAPPRSTFAVVQLGGNRTDNVSPELQSGEFRQLNGFAWSASGQRIAYWVDRCTQSVGFDCAKWQAVLMSSDLSTLSDVRIAVHNVTTVPLNGGPIAYAPDNRHVYYVLEGKLYEKEVS